MKERRVRERRVPVEKTLEQLYEEEVLLEADGEDEDGNLYALVELYKLMLRAVKREEPKNEWLRTSVTNKILKYLIKYGYYLKQSSVRNDATAMHSLQEALSLDKHNPIAHYRLAHLYNRQGDYVKALSHFQASRTYNERYENKTYTLDEQQLFHAYLYASNCSIKVAMDEWAQLDKRFPHEEEAIQRSEFVKQRDAWLASQKEISRDMDNIIDDRRYILHTANGKTVCSEERFEDVLFQKDTLLINASGQELHVKYNNAYVPISIRTAHILKYLFLHTSKEHVISSRQLEAPEALEIAHNTISVNLQRLEKRLLKKGIPMFYCITKNGYYFEYEGDCYIIENTDYPL